MIQERESVQRALSVRNRLLRIGLSVQMGAAVYPGRVRIAREIGVVKASLSQPR